MGPVGIQRRIRRSATDVVRTTRLRAGTTENESVEETGRPDGAEPGHRAHEANLQTE